MSFLFASVLMALLIWRVCWKETEDGPSVAPVSSESRFPIRKLVQYSFTLQNQTSRVLEKAELWTYVPVKETSSQRLQDVDASFPYELTTDSVGNQILHFTFHGIPPYASKILTIQADLAFSDAPNGMELPEPGVFLQPEQFVEADAPEIVKLADRLKGPAPMGTAGMIHELVARRIQYKEYVREDRGALYALNNGWGDCTEYMYLFVALCRAKGIPARGVCGYVCENGGVLKPSGYHSWAEFYDRGAWKIADPQRNVFMRNGDQYIAMRIINRTERDFGGGFHRFRFAGEGLSVKMN
jgi:transglutaminase-like putative cysteine protease